MTIMPKSLKLMRLVNVWYKYLFFHSNGWWNWHSHWQTSATDFHLLGVFFSSFLKWARVTEGLHLGVFLILIFSVGSGKNMQTILPALPCAFGSLLTNHSTTWSLVLLLHCLKLCDTTEGKQLLNWLGIPWWKSWFWKARNWNPNCAGRRNSLLRIQRKGYDEICGDACLMHKL